MCTKSFESSDFVFLDTETTGLSPDNGDKICEIAILRTKGPKITDEFFTLVNPGISMPIGALRIHGISDDMVKGAPRFIDISIRIKNMLEGAVLVAHNASFDLGFLFSEFRNINISKPRNDVFDTLKIARKYYNFPRNSLASIANLLGIKTHGLHRAYSDAMVTKHIFEYFVKDLTARRYGFVTLDEILNL